MHVAHCIEGLVEPRSNTMPQGSWRYNITADSPAFCPGCFWQYSNDNNQLLNVTVVMKAVASSRCQWYRAIAAEDGSVDKTTREFQERLRSRNVIDNWPRRDIAFVTDNIPLWSRYMIRHDISAESIVSLPSKLRVCAAYARHTRQALARSRG